jgi:hypothetical protein
VELQSRIDDLKRSGLGVAAISYDSPAVLADFARRRGITFPLLSDQGSATIKAYGLLNTTVQPGTMAEGVPFPGTFVLDRAGRVTERLFEDAYQERYTVSTILLRLGKAMERPVTEATTPHLRMKAYASDTAVVAGRHVSVVVDVTPNAGMHLYAPGAKGYKVIAVEIDAMPGLVVVETVYPPSTPYLFAPLKETVPVFKAPFRLVRDVLVQKLPPQTAGADASAAVITLSGRLTYQACDDKICYNPVSLPLSWTFTIGALDRDRSTIIRAPRE